MLEEWIDVKERLPGASIPVLIYDRGKEMCYVGYRMATRWWYGDHYGRWDARIKAGDITHWMPLPDPPSLEHIAGDCDA